jgi:transcriptional regulator with XRE-family HTH domain
MNPESLYKRIGAFIRTRRDHLGKSQEDLARIVRLSRASIANIEKGRQSILIHHLYAIAEALQLQPGDLLPSAERNVLGDELPLPHDLNAEEAKDVSRLFRLSPIQPIETPNKEGQRVKQTKRQISRRGGAGRTGRK